jgi:hypothetical protein
MKKYVAGTRKEDDLYYQGPFWIIADTFKDIHRGKFALLGEPLPCDYHGDYVGDTTSKSSKTHKRIWESQYINNYNNVDYTFYPRGRVAVYEGTAFIHLNSKCNIPSVIDAIIDKYKIDKLDIEIDLNDVYQGSHYDFQLK